MIPGYGPECDICTPDVHFLLKCPSGHEWDEPCSPGKFTCPKCGSEVEVTYEETMRWEREVVGISS